MIVRVFKALSWVVMKLSNPEHFIIYHRKGNNTTIVFNGETTTQTDVPDLSGNGNHLRWGLGFIDVTGT